MLLLWVFPRSLEQLPHEVIKEDLYVLYKFNCSVVLRKNDFFSSSKNCVHIIILGNVVLRSIKGRCLAGRLTFSPCEREFVTWASELFSYPPSPPSANLISQSPS